MKIFDISVPISGTMHVYHGDPPAKITRALDQEAGHQATVSRLDFGAHTGTHVDAPLHFIRGAATVDALDLNILIGPARVIDLAHVRQFITAADLEGAHLPAGTERILFKTRNEALWDLPGFQTDFVAFAEDGARWLVAHDVRLVAIDYLSAEAFSSPDFAVHKILLGAGIVIVEGVDLRRVAPGEYQLICLPIKLQGADGAPARAVLIQS